MNINHQLSTEGIPYTYVKGVIHVGNCKIYGTSISHLQLSILKLYFHRSDFLETESYLMKEFMLLGTRNHDSGNRLCIYCF